MAKYSHRAGNKPGIGSDGLSRATSRGAFWMLLRTVGTRIINLIGQLALVWLLDPSDFALFALANAVIALTKQLATAGVEKVLIQRSDEIEKWINAGFWISITTAALGAIATIGLSFIASRFYNEPRLGILILVLTPSVVTTALSMVPNALLCAQLRFRFLAIIDTLNAIGLMGLTISLAYLEFGALSFVIPMPIMGTIILGAYWLATKPNIRSKLDLARWKPLVSDSLKLTAASLFVYVTFQADYLILGAVLSNDKDAVGLYFFAFMLSTQVISLLTNSLGGVLFPALSKLNKEPKRRYNGFLKATSLLAVIGVPAAALQASLADPIVTLIFPEKWHPAIPILQILSLAMAIRIVGTSYQSLLFSMGMYNVNLLINLVFAILFCILVYYGTLLYGASGAALGVFFAYLIAYMPATFVTMILAGGKTKDFFTILAIPAGTTLSAVGIPWLATTILQLSDVLALVVQLISTTIIFVIVLKIFAPKTRYELKRLFDQIVRKRTE